jgi:transcriptional regulator with XRE-family HTH domain
MTTETSPLPTGVESESTNSIRQQLLQSLRTSKEYRHAFIEESIRTGLAAQTQAIREMRKMDPKTFADKLNRKVSWIYRLEDPNAPAPTIASLLEEAKAFDVDLQVRFRPFSERLDELTKLSEKSFDVLSFDEEVAQGAFAEQTAIAAYAQKTRLAVAQRAPQQFISGSGIASTPIQGCQTPVVNASVLHLVPDPAPRRRRRPPMPNPSKGARKHGRTRKDRAA